MTATTTALVTGANKGLGRETVRRLATMGWRVFLAARDMARGTEAAAELAKDGLDVEFVPLDVTSDASAAAAAEAVKARAGRLDVLVNNAGISGVSGREWMGMRPPSMGYPTSKAALNMITTYYSFDLSDMRVNAVDPGYTSTDFTGGQGFQSVTEGTDAIVRLATIGPDGPTGGFFDRDGTTAW
ncbi:SDR family NAD(P)-dependent oxidoreductase [Streptomyces sp. NPDC002643]